MKDQIDNSGELCKLASWAHVSTSMGEAFGNLGSFLERVKEQTLKGGPRCTDGGRLSELDVTLRRTLFKCCYSPDSYKTPSMFACVRQC